MGEDKCFYDHFLYIFWQRSRKKDQASNEHFKTLHQWTFNTILQQKAVNIFRPRKYRDTLSFTAEAIPAESCHRVTGSFNERVCRKAAVALSPESRQAVLAPRTARSAFRDPVPSTRRRREYTASHDRHPGLLNNSTGGLCARHNSAVNWPRYSVQIVRLVVRRTLRGHTWPKTLSCSPDFFRNFAASNAPITLVWLLSIWNNTVNLVIYIEKHKST